ncbi:MAG: hypothetical protein A4S08_04055 [Proteobacteria bacterium SG_bin4]|nr:MAG: hypothetical protein A4S08_04055 [Proteobacteria bacterium SG_bin4]
MKPKNLSISLLAAVFLILSSGAQARWANYGFSQLYDGTGPVNIRFLALLDVDDLGGGKWLFRLYDINLSAFGSEAFISSMAVAGPKPDSVAVVPGGGVNEVGKSPDKGPFDYFDYSYTFGSGSDKLVNGEEISWNVYGLTYPIYDGFYRPSFVLHVQGTNYSPDFAWYASGVPEPQTYATLLAGLGLLGFMAQQRKKRNLI